MCDRFYIPQGYITVSPTVEIQEKDWKNEIISLFILRLLNNSDITNFWCCTSVQDFCSFKDVIFSLKDKSNTIHNFAIQIKNEHYGISKFHLTSKKYIDEIETMVATKNCKGDSKNNSELIQHFAINNPVFIIHTLADSENNLSDKKIEEQAFNFKLDYLLNMCMGKLHPTNCEKLCSLFLYTYHTDIKTLKEAIQRLIENIAMPLQLDEHRVLRVLEKIVSTVKNSANEILGSGKPITREYILNIILVEILQPYIWNFEIMDSVSTNLQYWKYFLNKSKIAIEDDHVVREFLMHNITHTVLDYKNLSEERGESEVRTLNDVYKSMWRIGNAPLILLIDNQHLCVTLIEFFHNMNSNIRVIFLVKQECTFLNKLSGVCTTLKDFGVKMEIDVLYSTVYLQGRPTTLSEMTENTDLIQIKDVIYIVLGMCNIGDQLKPIIDNYIDVSFEKVWIKPEALQGLSQDYFIIKQYSYHNDIIGNFLEKCQINMEHKDFQIWENKVTENIEQRIIFVRNAKNPLEIKRALPNKTIHYLNFSSSGGLEWRYSFGNNENLKKYATKKGYDHAQKLAIPKQLHATLGSEIRIISGISGIGKSTLLDYIAGNASTKWWVARIDLRSYSPAIQKIGVYKSNTLNDIIFQYFLKTKGIMILIDGFDELEEKYVNEVLQMIKSFSKLNYAVYLTTGPSHKHFLEKHFNTFAMVLKPMTVHKQKTYLNNYFTSRLDISPSHVTKLINIFLNLPERWSAGIPLYMYMLADFFTANYETILNNHTCQYEKFDLVPLCEYFCNNQDSFTSECSLDPNDYQYYMFLYACKQNSFLINDHIDDELILKKGVHSKMLEILKKGTLLHVQNDCVTYTHKIFSEYMIACWLATNIWNKELIKKLFDPKFVNIRKMFDQIIAKDCPLHLAIISKRLHLVEDIIRKDKNAIYQLDAGGRSVLHLIGSWGTTLYEDVKESIHDLDAEEQRLLNYAMVNILKLIPNQKTSTLDKILNYSELDYAISSQSFCIANELCARIQSVSLKEMELNLLQNLGNETDDFFLLKTILRDTEFKSNNTIDSQNQNDNFALHLAVFTGNLGCISNLLSEKIDINFPDTNEMTPLHCAFLTNADDSKIIAEMLIQQGADLLRQDKCGKTPVHYAILHGNLITISFIEEQLRKLGNKLVDIANIADLEGRSIIHYAASKGLTTVAELFAGHKVNMTLKDCEGWTPLHLAAWYGHVEMVNLLLSCTKENLNWPDKKIKTPLLLATEKGYDQVIKALLEHGANVNVENQSNLSALCVAILKKDPKLVDNLLKHHANVEHTSKHKLTPLLLAVGIGHTEILNLLLDCNAKISACDDHGNSALLLGSYYGDKKTVRCLLDNGADIQHLNIFGNSPLLAAVTRQHTTIVEILINSGDNIEARNKFGWTPLTVASNANSFDIVRLLLQHKANIETSETANRRTPLMTASFEDNVEVIKLLLEHDALINACNEKSGQTALYYAVFDGGLESVKILLANNADMHHEHDLLPSPFQLAICKKHRTIVELFLNHGALLSTKDKGFCFFKAVRHGDIKITQTLIDLKVDFNCICDICDYTPLMYAAGGGHNAVMKILLEAGANINVECQLKTPLHMASSVRGSPLTIRTLLEYGANVNQKTQLGTPLFSAVYTGRTNIVKLLLENGAEVDIVKMNNRTALSLAASQDYTDVLTPLIDYNSNIEHRSDDGLTPLLYAALTGKVLNIQILLVKGASINAKDKRGKTALYYAAAHGHLEAVKILLDNNCEIYHRCHKKLNAMDVARDHGHLRIYELLQNRLRESVVPPTTFPNWRDRN